MIATATQALREQAPPIQNLMQLYWHDFSEFWAEPSKGDLLANGRIAPYPLDNYWSRPSWLAMLIGRDCLLAGFALINDVAHSGIPTERSVGEFFVLKKHGGNRVDRIAAHILFARYPGSWEVAVAGRNVNAGQFWEKTLESATIVTSIRRVDLMNDHWDGPAFRFESMRPPVDREQTNLYPARLLS